MNKDKTLYLSRKDVEEVGLSMPEIIEGLGFYVHGKRGRPGGLALDDMATAILIYRKAREKGIGM